jgi:hypothetical protein
MLNGWPFTRWCLGWGLYLAGQVVWPAVVPAGSFFFSPSFFFRLVVRGLLYLAKGL